MNDDFDNRKDDMTMLRLAMLRKLTGRDNQEMIMNSNDERDYDEETYNARILATGDGEAGDTDPGTRVIVFRVPVTIGAGVPDKAALAGMTRILARAWQRLVPMSELAGPVTVIPDGTPVIASALARVDQAQEAARSQMPDGSLGDFPLPAELNSLRKLADAARESGMCDRCGGNLGAGKGGGRYCGPCANTPDPDEAPEIPVTRTGSGFQVGLTALREAVAGTAATVRFTSPDGWSFGHDRRLHPDSAWRQRATAAEAALTAIGSIMTSDYGARDRLTHISRILREAGWQADRIMAQDQQTDGSA